jgi:CheY-like chemotaxis protein
MSRTLLLADDSTTMQRVVELTFAEQGVQVVSVSNGQEAIDYISSHQPSLALVSATLPTVNGFEVARFVRDHAESRVPVLLLAGAFDNLDDARVRESGAAGVIVKPFEPAVVIKRVKELLGMKPALPQPPLQPRPIDSTSSPLVATDGPKRESPAHTGIAMGGTTRAVDETPTLNNDYLAQLGAAFDSLDAQLAARTAPAGRSVNSAPSSLSASADPQPIAAPPSSTNVVAATPTTTDVSDTAKPVFEVDDNWFEKKPVAAESLGELTEFIVTRASDFASPAPATSSLTDRSWLPAAARAETQPVSTTAEASGEHDVAAELPSSVSTDSLFASAIAPVVSEVEAFAAPVEGQTTKQADAPDATPAPGARISAVSAPAAASEAPSPGPVDLSERSMEALTSQLTERVAARVGAPLADRLSRDLASQVTDALADRVVDAVAERVTARLEQRLGDDFVVRAVEDLAPRVSEQVGARVAAEVTARLSAELTETLSGSLGERISAGLAERVAERALGGALGDSLRQTVHEVAERVVRAEIERIKAAANSLRS